MSFYAIFNADESTKSTVVHRVVADSLGTSITDHFFIQVKEDIEILVIRIFQNDDELFAMRRLPVSMLVRAGHTVTVNWNLGVVAN